MSVEVDPGVYFVPDPTQVLDEPWKAKYSETKRKKTGNCTYSIDDEVEGLSADRRSSNVGVILIGCWGLSNGCCSVGVEASEIPGDQSFDALGAARVRLADGDGEDTGRSDRSGNSRRYKVGEEDERAREADHGGCQRICGEGRTLKLKTFNPLLLYRTKYNI